MYPESYDSYNADEITYTIEQSNDYVVEESIIDIPQEPIQPLVGPMDSAWPMHGYDIRHTGRSPYSTANNLGEEKWKFETDTWALSSPAIDSDGTVYIGSVSFYAVYPNGTLKWMYKIPGSIEHCCPAIDENGIIYIGTTYGANGNHLYAFYPNGTIKWKFYTGGNICSSPVIGDDGTIYFGHGDGPNDGHINAVYPNGTLRWRFHASHAIYSSPAIGLDGTIYCGSHDTYIYALYPDDGTLKWKFKTGSWVHGSPSIADDGTIYIGSDDKYLYALYPNGTLRWKTKIGEIFGSLALDKDGTIYAGVWGKRFYALYPNGTVKWSFDTGNGKIWGSSPALSDDGTIFFGTCDLEWSGGIDLIALYTDGTLKWRNRLDTVFSSPAIADDGTVYIGSCGGDEGYLNAYGQLDPDIPSNPTITGQTTGTNETLYEYKFNSTSPVGRNLYYYITWGDGSKKDWFGPFNSSEEVTVSHSWYYQGTYTIKARAKDTENLWGLWGELQVTMPRDKAISSSSLLRFLDQYPLLNLLLQRLTFL